MIDLQTSPIGTPHPKARCGWCQASLVVGQVKQLRAWLCPEPPCYRRQLAYAVFVKASGVAHAKLLSVPVGTVVCLNVPLPSQVSFHEATAKHVLWGGQAGPGKSHGVRWWLYQRALTVPKHEALLLRENWEQLEKHHLRRMKQEVPLLGGKVVERTAIFPNGSVIDCGHMADADAVTRYLSSEYGAIVGDEASQYPVDAEGTSTLAELSTRARKVSTNLHGQTVRPRFMPVSNPGGPSSPWLLDLFVDHTPDFEKFPALRKSYDPTDWVYLPAKLDDNPYQDPEYEDTLTVLSAWRYEQLRHGDWHVFAGQFFSKWRESRHIRDLDVPSGVTWFSSMDWGSVQPGCVGYYAVLPDHRIYRRSEIKFQGWDVAEVAAAMKRREAELGIRTLAYRVADPAMWIKDAKTHSRHLVGESIADTFRLHGLHLRQADHDRVNGWTRCLQLLRDAPDGHPWFLVHSDCRYFIRTIAAARSDHANPDDVDTHCDDHALDEWRYGAMSRPSPLAASAVTAFPVDSIAWLRHQHRPKDGLLTRGRRVA